MKIYITGLTLIALVSFFTACNKDKYTTEPQVKFKEISPDIVSRGNIVKFTCSFTDEEGDVDSIFIVQKWYTGSGTVTFIDTLKNNTYESTTAPISRSGDISLMLEYITANSGYKTYPWTPSNRDTTATLGMLLIDKAGNRSNYAESDKIILKKS